jgi:hypothetical protein
VAATVYGVIGDSGVLGGLRHPTMHPMQPLERGLGLCHVRTQVVLDEPPGELPRLTESVLGYVAAVSERGPVIYVACDGREEAAAGWRDGKLVLGPLRNGCDLRRRLLRRDPGAIDNGLRWLGVRGRSCVKAVGLDGQAQWEPGTT